MRKTARYFLYLVSGLQFFFAVALFLQWPFATQLWPFPGTTPLTFIFLSSILAAAAASTLWVAVTGNVAAIAGIGIDYVTILIPAAVLSFQMAAGGQNPLMLVFAVLCVLGALFGLALFLWGARAPVQGARKMPGLARWSFVIFIAALLVVGGQLILKRPNIIPWNITPELSVLIGWMFLGASVYFLYGLLRPSWVNTAGQLAGFLAYDLVLIVPFLNRLPVVAPEHRTGQIIYLIVVIYSGLLSIYYLFIYKSTRVWSRSPGLADGL